jgi:hypothetical protein
MTSPRPSFRRWLVGPLLLLLASATSIGFLEIAVRVAVPQPALWLDVYRPHPRLPFFTLLPDAHAVVDSGESRWEVQTDRDGLRVGRGAGGATLPVALWLGDSFAFGRGVDFEDGWIGRFDADPGRRFHHVDAAVEGYGPLQYAAVLDDLLAQGRPVRLVAVATFLGNDFQDTVWDKNLPVKNGVLGDSGDLRSRIKRHSHLYRALSRTLHRALAGRPGEVDPLDDLSDPARWKTGLLAEAEKRYRQAFAHIAETCQRRGLALVVVLLPPPAAVDDLRTHGPASSPDVAGPRAPLARASAILRALGIRFVDVSAELATLPTAETYLRFDHHFTPRGHQLVARAVRAAIPELP